MELLNSRAIIVLGMHRSGTSALTRVLNLLGIELGSNLLPKHFTNETGFWEHADIVEINEQILQQLDSSWFDTAPLPPNWWTFESMMPLREHAKSIIRRDFLFSQQWAIKDPRLCRLLPFWIPLLQEFSVKLHFIIIVRHPLEVAASLEKRDSLSYNTSLRLWLEYVFSSIQDSQSFPRVFVTYDDLLQNSSAVLIKVAQTLKIIWPYMDFKAIDAFLNPSLKHHTSTIQTPSYLNETLLDWSQRLYRAIAFNRQVDTVLNSIKTVEKNIVGSTAAFLLISRKLFEQIGGFNDSYQICFEDVELNLACLKYDKINYLANEAVCYHFESQTRDRKVSQTDYDNWRRFVTKLQPDIKLKLVGSQPGEIILGTGTI